MARALPEDYDYGQTKLSLFNGLEMPAVGIGTYRVRTYDDIFTLVDNALKAGYRLFDTAGVYGNEVLLGKALRKLLPKYDLEREDIFITTKLSPANHGTLAVPKALEKSLTNLGMDYVDMYLIHFPGAAKIKSDDPENAKLRSESWRAMVTQFDDGKMNSLGVCNYTIPHLNDFLNGYSHVPILNQVEFHPFYNQMELLSYCKEHCITMQAYCSFGGLSTGSKELIGHPVVKKIADNHERTPAQVLLVWALQQDVAVIPKSTCPNHIQENIKLDFRLTDDEMHSLHTITSVERKYSWDPSNVR